MKRRIEDFYEYEDNNEKFYFDYEKPIMSKKYQKKVKMDKYHERKFQEPNDPDDLWE